jgi:hypothetical protein
MAMIIDGTTDRLEDRLERLAKLHADGQLTDDEFRTAKSAVLAPPTSASAPHPSATIGTAVVPSTVRTLGPLRWRVWLFIAIVFGFVLGCLASAITQLQAPAGPIVCRSGEFVAGSTADHYGGTTSFNIDSACVTDDVARHVSQVTIIGVLWLEYAVVAFALIAAMVWVVRGLRGPPRPDLSSMPM